MKNTSPPHGKKPKPSGSGGNGLWNEPATTPRDNNPPDIDLGQHSMDSQYEVEEELLQRSNYENTTIFMKEIEKAKARASSMDHPFPHEPEEEHHAEPHTLTEAEKMSIKQSLEEIRRTEEMERMEFEKNVRRQSGLLGSLKRIFGKD